MTSAFQCLDLWKQPGITDVICKRPLLLLGRLTMDFSCSKLKAMEDKVAGMELTSKPEATHTRRYASSHGATQGHTQQSLPTTFLPTPAPHVDQRRIRDFTTTSHLEVSTSHQGLSQQVRINK